MNTKHRPKLTAELKRYFQAIVRSMSVLLLVPDRTVRTSGLRVHVICPRVVPPNRNNNSNIKHAGPSKLLKNEPSKMKNPARKRKKRGGVKNYASRSMIGAQFLPAMRARSSRRALSTSLRYSESTITFAIAESREQ